MSIDVLCSRCKKQYTSKRIKRVQNNKNNFCSNSCKKLFSIKEGFCLNCGNYVKRRLSQIRGSTKNIFCNSSCAASYNNTHKTKGVRISKLEVYLQKELVRIYPNIKFLFNNKSVINSELDIYIPVLKLAFELNGIFHYEPIYGNEKLYQIQNNDNRKFQACLEHNIELVIIDSSQLKYFKVDKAKKYLDILCHILNTKLST